MNNGAIIGKGCVHVYTGDGKGKTTAALGLALRASGAGLSVLIIQFMKGQHYSELDAVKKYLPPVRMEQYGSAEFCRPDSATFPEHRALAERGYARAKAAIAGGEADLIILDEIVTAARFNLVTSDDIITLMQSKPDGMELVLTGRGAEAALIEAADLVTEMKEIKHYYRRGIPARQGIEN